ncbi:hypothetical protein WJX82_010121 [Trebouxia sp. C0006]
MFHGSSSTETPYSNLHELTARDIDLKNFNFSSLVNKVRASPKGRTEANYKDFATLEEHFAGQGLTIVAFPCNQFLSQEPGSNKDIKEFARSKGFKGAASGDTSPISWNFAKFLVKKDGTVFGRYGPSSTAVDLTPHIEKLLAEDKRLATNQAIKTRCTALLGQHTEHKDNHKHV